jgi:hypothetical protein
MTEIEPPTDDLRALFARERDVSALDRVAIRTKLAGTIAAPAPATAAIAGTKLVWIAAAAIATAAGIWWLTHRGDDAPAPRAPTIETAPPAPAPEPSIATTAPEAPVAAPAPQAQAEPPVAKPTPSQAELLAKAWKALPQDPAQALALVELDRRVHAKGELAEERESLRIQALVALDRGAEAQQLATEFLARYPQSVHERRVKAVLRGGK